MVALKSIHAVTPDSLLGQVDRVREKTHHEQNVV